MLVAQSQNKTAFIPGWCVRAGLRLGCVLRIGLKRDPRLLASLLATLLAYLLACLLAPLAQPHLTTPSLRLGPSGSK